LRHLLVTSMLSCMIARVAVLPASVGATAVLLAGLSRPEARQPSE
jgi:hypothetical protein